MKEIKKNISINIGGFVKVFENRKNCNPKLISEGKNTIVNNGLKQILLLLIDNASRPTQIGVGTGVTPVDITDIDLELPIAGNFVTVGTTTKFSDTCRGYGGTTSYTSEPLNNRVITNITRNDDSQDNKYDILNLKTLSEMGLFDRYAKGNMYAHKLLIPPIDVDFEAYLSFAWSIYICRAILNDTGYILDSGLDIFADMLIDDNVLYEQYKYYPRGLNYGVVGSNGGSNALDTLGIIKEVARNKLVNYCIEEVDTIVDPTYSVKLIIQQMIPAFSFTGTIAEAGLYRVRKEYLKTGDIYGGVVKSIPFCRAIFPPVDASDDICITWTFNIINEPILI